MLLWLPIRLRLRLQLYDYNYDGMNEIKGSKGKISKGMDVEEDNGKIRYVKEEKLKIREQKGEKAKIMEGLAGNRT